jgi:hypothetical protein
MWAVHLDPLNPALSTSAALNFVNNHNHRNHGTLLIKGMGSSC